MSQITLVLMLTTGALFCVSVLITRARHVVDLTENQSRRGRDHELHWAAIRLRSNGHQGTDLQEMLCALTNCTPVEADRAIVKVGADI